MSLQRAVEIARAAHQRAHPKPTVGAVLVKDGARIAEGVTEPAGRHAEALALAEAGERARGATMFVTLEPCAHHGSTPPCADAIVAAGVERVVIGTSDPNPVAAGGAAILERGGVPVELADDWDSRVLHEAWRTWVLRQRPFVVYKTAVTLDGRLTVPGRRWVTGEQSRRLVHELRAAVDAVAVGGGTARADLPRLDAREVETPRGQPRRLAFTHGSLPPQLDLEIRSGDLADELRALAAENVQSLLLEGGAALAASFLDADLVDRLLVFVAPILAGEGPVWAPPLPSARAVTHLTARPVGDDVLLDAYVHEP